MRASRLMPPLAQYPDQCGREAQDHEQHEVDGQNRQRDRQIRRRFTVGLGDKDDDGRYRTGTGHHRRSQRNECDVDVVGSLRTVGGLAGQQFECDEKQE